MSDGSKCDIGRLQMMFGASTSVAVQVRASMWMCCACALGPRVLISHTGVPLGSKEILYLVQHRVQVHVQDPKAPIDNVGDGIFHCIMCMQDCSCLGMACKSADISMLTAIAACARS